MKKVLTTILIIIIIILAIAIVFLLYQNAQPKRVYFEEKTINLLGESLEKVCSNLCQEKGYDGWRGGEQKVPDYTCTCYKLVR